MDILLTTNQPPNNYYMAARTFISGPLPFHKGTTTGILQYTNCCFVPFSILDQYTGCCNNSLPSPLFPITLPNYKDTAAALALIRRLRSLADGEYPIDVPKNISTRMVITVSLSLLPSLEASCGREAGERCSASLNNISWVMPYTAILQAYYRYIISYFLILKIKLLVKYKT